MTSSHQRIMRELIILLSIRITSPQGLGRKKISISEKVHHREREKTSYRTSSVKHDTCFTNLARVDNISTKSAFPWAFLKAHETTSTFADNFFQQPVLINIYLSTSGV